MNQILDNPFPYSDTNKRYAHNERYDLFHLFSPFFYLFTRVKRRAAQTVFPAPEEGKCR